MRSSPRFKGLQARLVTIALVLSTILPVSAGAAKPDGPSPGQNLAISAKNLKFVYQSFEGDTYYPCTHTLESAATQDWHLNCHNPNGPGRKEFRVHLWVTTYHHFAAPKLSYEILYWVTDLTDPAGIRVTGATVWMHLNEPTSFASIQVSQSVDDDTAGVYLDLTPGK